MSFTPFIPNTSQWTDFFLKQVQNKRNGLEPVKADGPIGGGITLQDDSVKLTTVGRVKTVKVKGQPESVKVQITSPADSTVEQAESELKNIKDEDGIAPIIRQASVKRKASLKKRKKNTTAKGVKAKRFKDVFSK